jgi:hypothetical protein
MRNEDLVVTNSLGDNPVMEINPEQIEKLEAALARLEEVDPAEVPEPAAELANLLSSLLEEPESS